MKRQLITAAIAAVIGVAPLAAAAPASAAGDIHFVLNADHSLCVVDNGQGKQVTIGTSGCGTYHVGRQFQENGLEWQQWIDANGNCIRAKTDDTVEIGNGSCSTSDNGSYWAETGSNNIMESYPTSADMCTQVEQSGAGVITSNNSGTWRIVAVAA